MVRVGGARLVDDHSAPVGSVAAASQQVKKKAVRSVCARCAGWVHWCTAVSWRSRRAGVELGGRELRAPEQRPEVATSAPFSSIRVAIERREVASSAFREPRLDEGTVHELGEAVRA